MKHQLSDADAQEFHREQYKMLREEIVEHQREMNRTEVSGILGVGAIYGWLLLHKASISSRAAWFIAPCLVLLCVIRNTILTFRINQIGTYLKSIEEILLGADSALPGWEHYYAKHGKPSPLTGHTIISIIVACLAIGATLAASWFFSR